MIHGAGMDRSGGNASARGVEGESTTRAASAYPGSASPPVQAPAAVWVLVVCVFTLPVLWVWFARGAGVGDGTHTYPSLPAWSTRGVAVIDTVPDRSPLRRGDCVTAVAGIPLTDLARGEQSLPYGLREPGARLEYTVRRPPDGSLGRACTGPLHQVTVTVQRYPLAEAAQAHLGGLPLLVTMLGVGSFVLVRRPFDPAARALFAAAAAAPASITTWPLGNQVIDLALGPRSWPYLWPFVVGEVAGAVGWGALLHFAVSFPRSPRWAVRRRAVAALYAVPFLIYLIATGISLLRTDDPLEQLGTVTAVSRWEGPVMPFVLTAVLLVQYRRTVDPQARTRMRWVLYAFLACTAFYLVLGQLPNLVIGHPAVSLDWDPILFLPFPLALGAAVLRYSLFDIEVIVRRSLVYVTVTAAGAVTYVLLVLLVDRLTAGRHSLLTAVLAGVIVLRLQPLLAAARRRLSRMVFGSRDDPGEVLSRVADTVGGSSDPAGVLPALAEVVAGVLRLTYVGIRLRLPDGSVELTEHGEPADAPVTVFPLCHQDERIGDLTLSAGRHREPLGPSDQRLIDPLVAQVAVAAHNVLLHRQLHRSLERVVSVREEERRRLRRDIHDGLGPSLAAGALRLEAAQTLVVKAPDQAQTVIEEVIALQRRVIDDMRALVDGLRPPVLDQLGLVAAIRQQLESLGPAVQGTSPMVVLTSPHRVALPAAVEVAAYRIVSEALTNACHHARATRIDIRLSLHLGRVVIEVEDDGVGLHRSVRTGMGLLSIRERAEEIGGTSRMATTAAGGTLVRAELPLPGGQLPHVHGTAGNAGSVRRPD